MKYIVTYINDINKHIFKVFLFSYLSFLTIDLLSDNFVSKFFNINIFIVIVIMSGIIIIVMNKFHEKEKHNN